MRLRLSFFIFEKTGIAKAHGAIVIGTCSERSSEYVKSLGADHVVDYNKGSISEQVATMTHLTIDCVYDCIGGDNTKEGEYSKRMERHANGAL